MAELPRLLIYADRRKGEVRAFLEEELRPWLQGRGEIVATIWRGEEATSTASALAADCILVLGGDGSILAAARFLGHLDLPTIGLNLGRLGFLAAGEKAEFRQVLEVALAGGMRVQERTLIEYEIVRADDSPSERGLALNEVLVARSSRGGLIVVELELEGVPVADYRGDGLLVSTPTGSTAYNLAAGGPLLDPTLEAFCVTPICPHQLSQRPLVVGAHLRFGLRLVEGPRATLSLDGQVWRPLREGDRLSVRAAERRFKWCCLPQRGFYHRLRSTLGWGQTGGALPRPRGEDPEERA